MKSIYSICTAIEATNPRSAWNKGVKLYALELLDELEESLSYAPEALDNAHLLERALLNGARSWQEYSWGGCSLISDYEIANRLCNATEFKRTDEGRRQPNGREHWLDVQARALHQAARLILTAYQEG